MYIMLKNLLTFLFILNALFWGLCSHEAHCSIGAMFGSTVCLPHWFHVYVLGVGSFSVALFLQHGTAGFIEFVRDGIRKYN